MEQERSKIRLQDLHKQISDHLEVTGKKPYGFGGFYSALRRILKNQPDLLPIIKISNRNYELTGPFLPKHISLFAQNNPAFGRKLEKKRYATLTQFQHQLEEIRSIINERENYRFQTKKKNPSYGKIKKKSLNLMSIIKNHYEGILRGENPKENLSISIEQLKNDLNKLHPNLNASSAQINRALKHLKEGDKPLLPIESFKITHPPLVRSHEEAQKLMEDKAISEYFDKFLTYNHILFKSRSIKLPKEYLELPKKEKIVYAKRAFVKALMYSNPISKIYIMIKTAGYLQQLFKSQGGRQAIISYNDEIDYQPLEEKIDFSLKSYGKNSQQMTPGFGLGDKITHYLFEMQTVRHNKINPNHALWYHLSRLGGYSNASIARHFGVKDEAVRHALIGLDKKVLKRV